MGTNIVAIANHKGGVGKTTSTVSIGAALATRGYKILLVDLDAQANLTISLLPPDQSRRSIYQALKERKDLPIIQVKDNLAIVPSSLDLAGVELEISSYMSREFILSDLIKPIIKDYDVVLLDCPPSLGLITLNAFAVATDVIVPLTAEALPTSGLQKLREILAMAKDMLNPGLKLSGIVLTRWEGRNLNKMVEDTIGQMFGDVLCKTRIRTNVQLAEAPLSQTDIFTYNKKCNGAIDYSALTDELIMKLDLRTRKPQTI